MDLKSATKRKLASEVVTGNGDIFPGVGLGEVIGVVLIALVDERPNAPNVKLANLANATSHVFMRLGEGVRGTSVSWRDALDEEENGAEEQDRNASAKRILRSSFLGEYGYGNKEQEKRG
ncbi:hypothetical protein [Prosthecobacter sp.]|uniref:hypothetical protein n=1 Tax=Prosthecobacter sp. TaxID=1965333 RepID=UPI00378526F2